jgi:lysophospholipase L1-like esterase
VPAREGLDYIFIRYGINDEKRRENFTTEFPKDFHELLTRLRHDHPQAMLIPMTVIPYALDNTHVEINALVTQIATAEGLKLFDIAPRYLAELQKGPNMLNYRRFALAKIPEKLRALAQPYVMEGPEPAVVVLDNRLDAHFGDLPGWYGDRHPSLAGYHVIADETAKFLVPIIRARMAKSTGAQQ